MYSTYYVPLCRLGRLSLEIAARHFSIGPLREASFSSALLLFFRQENNRVLVGSIPGNGRRNADGGMAPAECARRNPNPNRNRRGRSGKLHYCLSLTFVCLESPSGIKQIHQCEATSLLCPIGSPPLTRLYMHRASKDVLSAIRLNIGPTTRLKFRLRSMASPAILPTGGPIKGAKNSECGRISYYSMLA